MSIARNCSLSITGVCNNSIASNKYIIKYVYYNIVYYSMYIKYVCYWPLIYKLQLMPKYALSNHIFKNINVFRYRKMVQKNVITSSKLRTIHYLYLQKNQKPIIFRERIISKTIFLMLLVMFKSVFEQSLQCINEFIEFTLFFLLEIKKCYENHG